MGSKADSPPLLNTPTTPEFLPVTAGTYEHLLRGYANSTPLLFADAETTALLLKHGANANVTDDIGFKPLWTAIIRPEPAVVRLLVEHGADVNAPNWDGHSNLYREMKLTPPDPNQVEIVRLLKHHGARLNKKDQEALK